MLQGIRDYLAFLFTFQHRVYALRKKYDRERERADRTRGERRLQALRALDHVEPTLIMLEEQNVSRFERGRMVRFVEDGIKQAEGLRKDQPASQARR